MYGSIGRRDDYLHVTTWPRSPWLSRGIYGPAFQSVATKSAVELGLRENDYVFGDLKV